MSHGRGEKPLNPGYETIITKVLSRKGKEARLELEETRFHASGGGQPGDTGRLVAPGFSAEVMDCLRDGGTVVLAVRVMEGEPIEGLKVRAEVNLSRQALLSRMHSGEHVLSRVLESAHEGLEVYKVAVAEEETTVFMHWGGELGWDRLFEAEDGANEVISRDLPVTVRFYEPGEAPRDPGVEGELGTSRQRAHQGRDDSRIRLHRLFRNPRFLHRADRRASCHRLQGGRP